MEETKQGIRKRHLFCRNRMTKEEIEAFSGRIIKHIKNAMETCNSREKHIKIYGYYPLGSEVSLLGLYDFFLEQGIPLAFPKVKGMDMDFYQVYSMEDFKEGSFHVQEPENCKMAEWEHAVCFTPGTVFDRAGVRFGYGKGYYDRYFAGHSNILRVGIAYENQIEEKLPGEAWDLPMHYLVTEQGIMKC